METGERVLVHPCLVRRCAEDITAAARKEEECHLKRHSRISRGTHAQSWGGTPADTGSLESTPLLFSLPVLKVQVACQQCGTSFLRKVEWSKCFACILSCRIMVPINCHFMEAKWTMVQKVKEKKGRPKLQDSL